MRESRGVGERIVGWCLGALACAIALTLTIALLQRIWVELTIAVVLLVAAIGAWGWYRMRNRW